MHLPAFFYDSLCDTDCCFGSFSQKRPTSSSPVISPLRFISKETLCSKGGDEKMRRLLVSGQETASGRSAVETLGYPSRSSAGANQCWIDSLGIIWQVLSTCVPPTCASYLDYRRSLCPNDLTPTAVERLSGHRNVRLGHLEARREAHYFLVAHSLWSLCRSSRDCIDVR